MAKELHSADTNKTTPIIALPFNPKDTDFYFKNVSKVTHNKFADNNKDAVFRVFDEHGNDTGMISYLGENEWRVYVDNFPGEKQYYQWNLPTKTLDDFIRDVGRTGLKIVPYPLNIHVGSKVKAAVRMENDLRDDGMGVTLCADKGDILVVHEIPRPGVISVSLESSRYQFNCSLSEITAF